MSTIELSDDDIEAVCKAWATLDTIARRHACLAHVEAPELAERAQPYVLAATDAIHTIHYCVLRHFPAAGQAAQEVDPKLLAAALRRYLKGAYNDIELCLDRGTLCLRIFSPEKATKEQLAAFNCVHWPHTRLDEPNALMDTAPEAYIEVFKRIKVGMYLDGINPRRLNCDAVEAPSCEVDGWYPADAGADESQQEYELIMPERLSSDFEDDIDDLGAEACIAWLVDYDQDSDVQRLRKSMPRPPLAGVAAEDLAGEISQLTLADGVQWLREFAADECEELIAHAETLSAAEVEVVTRDVREHVARHYDQLFDSWQDDCREAVRDNIDGAREDWRESNEPVMNYYYPVDSINAEEAEAIAQHTPLVAITLQPQGKTALVLSGGGMDFSWDIAFAHILAGYYPPSRIDLPSMAGDRLDRKHRTIIAACRESHLILMNWLSRRLERTAEVANYMLGLRNR